MSSSQLRLFHLEFGALLTYTPRVISTKTQASKDAMYLLKKDGYLGNPPILMSESIAKKIQDNMNNLPFASFLGADTTLVPTPKSSLMKADTLWVPKRIADALIGRGLGKVVSPCLVRTTAIRKAAFCQPQNRPLASEHYESIAIQGAISEPKEILLIDDIITRGATLIGAANRLADAFPNAKIRAFAAMRTISDPNDFKDMYDPCKGTITIFGTAAYRTP